MTHSFNRPRIEVTGLLRFKLFFSFLPLLLRQTFVTRRR